MTMVQQMIYEDARRQLMAGAFFSMTSFIFIVGLIFYRSGSFLIALVYSFIFSITGIALLKAGYNDLQKSKKVEGNFYSDHTLSTIKKVPARMYMGRTTIQSFQSGLFAMDGTSYGEIAEDVEAKQKPFYKLAGLFSYDQLRPAVFTYTNEGHEPLYRVEKKGGFKWRGYVQNSNGQYVAYTKESKEKATKQRITSYVESGGCRWSAKGDEYIGHFTIKDQEGKVWAVIKRGVIPREAADLFERMPGYLVEWKVRENIPSSLVAFLFLLHSRAR
ncbi:hypothetical protein SAMN05192559_10199 [Halobacillus karajensis]|uniref:hypothetical protein n=1 Tax=Halobacillus karajensis TaxID=195088 RepID=UPI0008A7BE84|nr:hypothetical protein [Halobacillus karajensis]SEH39423.1 hypothetical protein SAMN05192559_10199 [Halobacillus karajensis]